MWRGDGNEQLDRAAHAKALRWKWARCVWKTEFTRAAGKWRVRVMATGEHAQEVARGQITPGSCLSWWGWVYSESTGRFWTSKTWSVLIAASLFQLIYVTQAYLLKGTLEAIEKKKKGKMPPVMPPVILASITTWFSTRMIALPMGDLAITRDTFGCYN